MSLILKALREHAFSQPDAPALEEGTGDLARSLTYAGLLQLVEATATQLMDHALTCRGAPDTAREDAPPVVGLLADNGIDWVVADLAALQAGLTMVPLPAYFSTAQLFHTIQAAGITLMLLDDAGTMALQAPLFADMDMWTTDLAIGSLHAVRLKPDTGCHHAALPSGESAQAGFPIPPGTQKITFTSGTTDAPKGVCLGIEAMDQVASSLLSVISNNLLTGPDGHQPWSQARHLCVLPLATLLENSAGVYLPLMAGATCLLPPLAQVGLAGSSGFDVVKQLSTMASMRATSAILVPQMLTAQVAIIKAGMPVPESLRYLAVGGGSVSPLLLAQANKMGLPVVEGYGLSECASVVALNQVETNRYGSVGKPLPHVRVTIADDGEVIVHGSHFLGYLGSISPINGNGLATGDIGYLDKDGFLFITGRKKSMFITAFGRNVAPEWVERELTAQPGLLQAAVFGEARATNVALIVPHPLMSHSAIATAVANANQNLPDYAQVGEWIITSTPFSQGNGLLTHNGRLRRSAIYHAYAEKLEPQRDKDINAIL